MEVVKPMTTMADWTDISNQITLPDTLNEVTQGALFVLAQHVGDLWVDDLQVIVPPVGVVPLQPSAATTPGIDFVANQAVFNAPTDYVLKVLAPNGRGSGHAVGFGERAVFNARRLVPGRYILELTTRTGGKAVQPLSIVR